MTDFHGIFPYFVSPIDSASGRVEEGAFRYLVEHLIQWGTRAPAEAN